METLSNLVNTLAGGDALTNRLIILVTGLLTVAAVIAAGRMLRRTTRSGARGNWSGQQVLIVVAIAVAFAVAGIGGVQSFRAVSDKFDSPLVPLVADGMVIACTALRLAALTRGWRIPGALLTTYVFIGGTVALNIDAANGAVDVAIAHALAPLAYAVLVEMLAHMLRLHLKLSQPARAKLSALTWFTSPVITTRVWLHLSRTGTTDPVVARALVQQVVRMSSRLNTVCPSRRGLPLDSARAARSAALQTIRDGLLTAGQLAALLPTTERMGAGQLLALVDSAALGLPVTDERTPARADIPVWLVLFLLAAQRDQINPGPAVLADVEQDNEDTDEDVHDAAGIGWPLIVGYVFGALLQQSSRTTAVQSTEDGAPLGTRSGAPALHREDCTSAPALHRSTSDLGADAPMHHPAAARHSGASVISAPVSETPQSGAGGGREARGKRSDESYLAELVEVSRRDHSGEPLTQREITRVTGVGFPKARRLAELAGWADPRDPHGSTSPAEADANSNQYDADQHPDSTPEAHELESSSSR